MMRQLLIVAMIFGATLTTASLHANDFDVEVTAKDGEKPKKEKKEKKPKGEKPEKAAKQPKAKPTEFSLTGTLAKVEKNDKAMYTLETDDGNIALRGKKASELDAHVGKTVTISGKGKMMENPKGKALVIIKLDSATAE